MKLWIDDVRPMPEGFDIHCKTFLDSVIMIGYIQSQPDLNLELVSFDHDLGENKGTGYDIANWIEYKAAKRILTKPFKWEIHSANPVGRKRIEQAMKSAERFWKENESN